MIKQPELYSLTFDSFLIAKEKYDDLLTLTGDYDEHDLVDELDELQDIK